MKYYLVDYRDCDTTAYDSLEELQKHVAQMLEDGDIDPEDVEDLDVFCGDRYTLAAKRWAKVKASQLIDLPTVVVDDDDDEEVEDRDDW
jgi:hypothetical protein